MKKYSRVTPVLYDLAATVALTACSPLFVYKALKRPRYRTGFSQRFGNLKPGVVERFRGLPFLWVHACSVGEVRAGLPVVEELRRRLPDHKILVSTVTETGNQIAEETGLGDEVIYLPLDVFHIWHRILDQLHPRAFIILETEIWPAMIGSLARHDIPIALVNGRISDRALERYKKAVPIFRPVLGKLDLIAVQSDEDGDRYRAIGAPADRVQVLGNTKYDAVSFEVADEDRERFRRELDLAPDDIVWIAGSTFPGEEALVGRVFQHLRQQHPQLRLLVAPRHPQRFDDAEREMVEGGLQVVRKTSGRTPEREEIVLLDTMGELSRLYGIGHLVFIGKSLLAEGGQNPLEPAGHGCAILHGPHMQNFRKAAELLAGAEASVLVPDEATLREAVADLLAHPERRRAIGERAREAVKAARGASRRIAGQVVEMMKKRGAWGPG